MKFARFCSLMMPVLAIAACAPPPDVTTAAKVTWSDGDSGRNDGERFRLADVDAPETGPVGSERGAKCEAERRLGGEARTFMRGLTDGADITVRIYETDQYGRMVIGLDANGRNVTKAALQAGHLRDWPHENGRATRAKPDWCS